MTELEGGCSRLFFMPSSENYIIQDPKAFYVLTGIVFNHSFSDSKEPLPLEVKYYLCFSCFQRNYLFLRLIFHQDGFQGWSTSFFYPPNLSQEPRDCGHSNGGSPGYNKEGFLAIQHATDKAIMWHHALNATTKMFESLNVLVKRFPHGAYVQDRFFLVLQDEFPVLLMLSFICIELITINSIVLEKEKTKVHFHDCDPGVSFTVDVTLVLQ
ncbi:ATP-binding cassette sub-family A member 17-like [Vicugna pacos]|uniref:ATP-binding cassette sub-family A member 17-like n=1 Tax=Vicugna pacos TaxID=30538 RepID=A0ABM5BPA0_VICPA